jgi:hypothetical protein
VTIARHFLRLSAFEDASPEQILEAARGWTAYLADEQPQSPPAPGKT